MHSLLAALQEEKGEAVQEHLLLAALQGEEGRLVGALFTHSNSKYGNQKQVSLS